MLTRLVTQQMAGADRGGGVHEENVMARSALPEDPLKRPPQKWLDNFQLKHLGRHTVGDFIEKRFSLMIYCVDCPRVIEWTPAELTNRFYQRPSLRLTELIPRLVCTCKSARIAVGPRYNKLTAAERQAMAPPRICEPLAEARVAG